MYCSSRKFRSNWLGATALAGSLGISIFSLTAIQPVMAQSIYLSGGGGGGGSLTGNGGYGAGALISAEKPDIRGHGGQGSGENGGAGGAGGTGASDSYTGKNTLTDDQKNALDGFNFGEVSDGNPVQGDKINNGGKGANVSANITKDISIENIILEAGDGGNPALSPESPSGTVGTGGEGGKVELKAGGKKITVTKNISVTSGKAGGNEPYKSTAGNAEFSAGTIIVGSDDVSINLTRYDGDLLFKTNQLDASNGDLTLNLYNTESWTTSNDKGVTFGNLTIGMGRKVTITGNGEYSISSLTIGNKVTDLNSESITGGDFIDPAKFSITNDLTLGSNSNLIFYLPENVQNGDSLLRMTGDGKVAINDAAVELKLAGTDLRRLSPGDQIRLIEGDVVGVSKTTEASVSNGAKNWNFDISTERENLVASLKGNKAPENTGEETNKGDNSGNNQNNTGGDNSANNAGSGNDSNNNQDKANNNGANNKPDLIGKDDGKGNIYTDNHGAVTINRAKANAYFQSNAAALNALNYGADQIASIDDYVLPMDVKKFGQTVEGVAFLQGSGFRQKVETGSHIKNDGYHLMGGAGIRYHEDQGNLLATVFIEHGDGDYDTYHQSIHGKGDFSYTGAGLYAKQTWDNGWFIDGSGRGGRVKRDFKSSDIVNGRFDDKSSNYYGFHIGGGKELEISPDNKLTLNGRLLWTRIEDFSTVTKADEHLGFDSANSVRTHLGARVDHKVTQEAKLYAGAAWEQELDGEIEGKLDSYRVDKPDFSGASAVFEVGGKYEQNQGMQGWVANAGVKGVAGKRDEISGKVGVGYRW
ncbi:autotransporter outer membrane beta-barrel domain-containing protein [uncultured Bartonella sp.]|uniref:autotransporter outer membrane beta-barrel domain-containing protein n=1 Tax=uncultured Bartonella sp. TaxID=104108 RepID=UPI0025D9057C|nr:autotransporter outer membrane beta-barrel domain-containing protein [uncultured Bartonella sp.]